MTDLIVGDPDALAQFTTSATYAANGPHEAGTAYASSWTAFVNAPGAAGAPASKAALLGDLLRDLVQLDQEPGLFGQALAQLDADGDGRLTEGDGVDATGLLLAARAKVLDPARPLDAATVQDLSAKAASLVHVERDAGDGSARVVRLDVNSLDVLKSLSPADAQAIMEMYGLTGESGPVQFVIHGYRTTTEGASSAGAAAADLYDGQGTTGATVVVVDWAEGSIIPIDWSGEQQGFVGAYESSRNTGDAMGVVFQAVADANPDANVSVFAHSLGNNVGLRGLTNVVDPIDPLTGQPTPFQVDYTAIEPAIPRSALNPDGDFGGSSAYGALTNGRIKNLTLTINKSDDALELYAWEMLHNAFGDMPLDDPALRQLYEQRGAIAGSSTLVMNQDNQVGGPGSEGHLTIDPNGIPFVKWLAMYQQQRAETGVPPGGTEVAKSLVFALYPDGEGDGIWNDPRMSTYINTCAEDENPPDLGYVAELARHIQD